MPAQVEGTWPCLERVRSAGSAFFRGQGRGHRVVAARGLAEAHEAVGELVDRLLPQVGQTPRHGTGEGWAIVAAPTTQAVLSALGTLVRTVRVERPRSTAPVDRPGPRMNR